MPDSASPVGERHARFLVERLCGLGLQVELVAGNTSGVGVLPLHASSFPSLKGSFTAEQARFYTLGHNRIKVFEPAAFFSLPAIDIARCESRDAIEAALRKAWSEYVGELMEAHRWLKALGATVRTDPRGGQLLVEVADVPGPAVRVRSRRELLVPSAGPLRQVSLPTPESRCYRPAADMEHAIELDTGLQDTMNRAAEQHLRTDRARYRAPAPTLEAPEKNSPRILLVDDDRGVRAAAESALAIRGFHVDAYPDPLRALEALRQQTYDAVLADARMPRMDGLELAMQVRDLPGLARLPVLIFDERPSPASREAAQSLGAVGYVAKPSRWTELAEGLLDLLEGWSQRRYGRYPARLKVEVGDRSASDLDLTYQVGRGGVGLQTRRDVIPGAKERYRIALPGSAGTVNVDVEVVHRLAESGQVTLRLGVRFLRFPDRDEPRWIRLIESLAQRAAREGSASGDDR